MRVGIPTPGQLDMAQYSIYRARGTNEVIIVTCSYNLSRRQYMRHAQQLWSIFDEV